MHQFDLSHAVASFSHHSTAISTLWGIYVAATFAAAGFGVSLQEDFTFALAAFLSVGFLAFTYGHYVLLRQHIRIQEALRGEILNYLREAPHSTNFDGSIRAICRNSSNLPGSRAAHVVIDLCVLALVWSRAFGLGPLNYGAG